MEDEKEKVVVEEESHPQESPKEDEPTQTDPTQDDSKQSETSSNLQADLALKIDQLTEVVMEALKMGAKERFQEEKEEKVEEKEPSEEELDETASGLGL